MSKNLELSNLVRSSGGSIIRKMFNESLKITDKVNFTVGEPDFITPQPIIDAACRGWQAGLTHYTPNAGILELRQEIAKYETKLDPDPESQVIITAGGTEAIQLALFTLVNPGEEVIMITPTWPNYFGQISMCGGKVKTVEVSEENGFIATPEELKQAITKNTKAIIINSPSNPTGAVVNPETIKAYAEIIANEDVFVITDEVYNRIVYDGESFSSLTDFPELKNKIVYINSFSKMFAMTGWRLGYAISTPEIVQNMIKMHENGASCLSGPSQMGAAEALRSCQDDIERMRSIYEKRRNLIYEMVNDIDGISCIRPKGAFYAFVNIKETGMSSEEFCMSLLKKAGVVGVPGSGFGSNGEGYVRFSYATSEENIIEGFKRVRKFMESL